jgi:hypothetical protein
LSPRQPDRAPSAQAGHEQIHHRGLANPRFATDKNELAHALSGPLEPPLQGSDFALAPHNGAGRQRWWDLQGFPHEEPISLPSDRFEIARRGRRITQCRPNLLDRHPQYGIGDMRSRPHVLTQLGFGHQTAGVLNQIAQHGPRAGTQGNHLLLTPEAPVGHFEAEGSEGNVVLVLLYRVSQSFHLDSS